MLCNQPPILPLEAIGQLGVVQMGRLIERMELGHFLCRTRLPGAGSYSRSTTVAA